MKIENLKIVKNGDDIVQISYIVDFKRFSEHLKSVLYSMEANPPYSIRKYIRAIKKKM